MALPEETSYRKKQVLLGFQKDLTGNTLSKAYDISAFAESVSLTSDVQLKDTTRTNNNGQNSASITGKANFEGTITLDNPRPLTGLLLAAVLGKPTSFVSSTAAVWATLTVHEKGDTVSLSGGKFLVAQNGGTTGATEPTITTEVDYQDLATLDGDIKWKVRDTLFEGTGYATSFCTEQMIIIERAGEGCGSGNIFDRIVEGVELTYFSMGQTDGEVTASQAIPIVGRRERRSTQSDFVDVAVTTVITPREDYWTNSQCLIRVDGEKYGTLLDFMLTYTRNVTAKDVVGEYNEKTVSTDAPTFEGNVSIKLVPSEYENLRTPKNKAVTISMNGFDGEIVDISIPQCQFYAPAIEAEGSRELWMTATLKPLGNSTQAMATVNISTATNLA